MALEKNLKKIKKNLKNSLTTNDLHDIITRHSAIGPVAQVVRAHP